MKELRYYEIPPIKIDKKWFWDIKSSNSPNSFKITNEGKTIKKIDSQYDRYIFSNKGLNKGTHKWRITID